MSVDFIKAHNNETLKKHAINIHRCKAFKGKTLQEAKQIIDDNIESYKYQVNTNKEEAKAIDTSIKDIA